MSDRAPRGPTPSIGADRSGPAAERPPSRATPKATVQLRRTTQASPVDYSNATWSHDGVAGGDGVASDELLRLDLSGGACDAAPLQRKTGGDAPDPAAQLHQHAALGVRGAPSPLPHRAAIQQSFGPAHDLGAVEAHVGGAAGEACEAIGATAYASGNAVAFAAPPDLHTAAHEAAHVVQQAQGVMLYGGVGAAGDAYEVHADAVADRVVAGESAADLLGPATVAAGAVPPGDGAVQRLEAPAARASASWPIAVIATTPLRIRSAPDDGVDDNFVGHYEQGAQIEALGAQGPWLRVSHRDRPAFIHGKHTRPAAAPPGAAAAAPAPAAAPEAPASHGFFADAFSAVLDVGRAAVSALTEIFTPGTPEVTAPETIREAHAEGLAPAAIGAAPAEGEHGPAAAVAPADPWIFESPSTGPVLPEVNGTSSVVELAFSFLALIETDPTENPGPARSLAAAAQAEAAGVSASEVGGGGLAPAAAGPAPAAAAAAAPLSAAKPTQGDSGGAKKTSGAKDLVETYGTVDEVKQRKLTESIPVHYVDGLKRNARKEKTRDERDDVDQLEKITKSTPVHKKLAPLFREIFAAIETSGDWKNILEQPWAYNPRENRNNATEWSIHSWGTAIDVNATTNPNDGSGATDRQVVVAKHFTSRGFTWLRDPDAMHFQYHDGGAPKITDEEVADIKAGKHGGTSAKALAADVKNSLKNAKARLATEEAKRAAEEKSHAKHPRNRAAEFQARVDRLETMLAMLATDAAAEGGEKK